MFDSFDINQLMLVEHDGYDQGSDPISLKEITMIPMNQGISYLDEMENLISPLETRDMEMICI